ncbi:MAG TPA: GNVR domain-containing protein, partial [Methylomirabilota bacterium]|nr:GNVR domain-containing protein [Methylomirabilota bacterium]
DYETAAAREASTKAAVDAATASVNDASDAAVIMRELENAANAQAEMYRAFVNRLEETSRQQTTQISDARVIAPADVPNRPFAPRRNLVLALAGLAGLGTGLSAALYRGRRDLVGAPARDADRPRRPSRKDTARIAPAADAPHVRDAASPAPVAAPALRGEPAAADTEPPAAEPLTTETPTRQPPDLPMLGRVAIDTAPTRSGRAGRPIARSARAIAMSGVERADGRVDYAAIGDLAATAFAGAAATSRLIVIRSFLEATPTGAAAYALARAAATLGPTLLVDGGQPGKGLAAALLEETAPALLDVIAGTELADRVAELEEEDGLTVAPLIGRASLDEAGGAAAGARFLADLADSFTTTLVVFPTDAGTDLLDAMAERAQTVLGLVDGARADAADTSHDVRLAAAVSGCDGLVAVDDRARGLCVVA